MAHGVLPGVQDVIDDFWNSDGMFDLCENIGAVAPHFPRVAFHDAEVCSHGWGQISLIDHQEVRLSQTGPTFPGNLIATSDVDHLNGVVCQFPAEAGCQIIAAGFEEKDVRLELLVEFFQGNQVGRDVLPNGGVGATTGLNRTDSSGIEGLIANQEFAVFPGEDVVGHGGKLHPVSEVSTELQHQSRLPTADWPADTHGEGSLMKISMQGALSIMKMAGVIQMFMGMSNRTVVMSVGVGVRVRMHGES